MKRHSSALDLDSSIKKALPQNNKQVPKVTQESAIFCLNRSHLQRQPAA